MKNLIFIITFLFSNYSFSQSEIPLFKTQVNECKISGTEIGKRIKVGKQFFAAEKDFANVNRFFQENGKFEKVGSSKNRLFGGFSFTPKKVGKYFILVSFRDSEKNRMLEIEVHKSHFDLKLFKKSLKTKTVKVQKSKVGILKKSELPDFENATTSNLEEDFFGCDLRDQRFVKIANCEKYILGNVIVEYFYRKTETSKLYLLVDEIETKSERVGLHVPWVGIYFVKCTGENGVYYFKLSATDLEGKGKELFTNY